MTHTDDDQEQKVEEQDQKDYKRDDDDIGGYRSVDEKPPEDEIQEIEEERERRLDPDNRPEGAEVDNTQRTFEDGEFKD